MTETVIDFSGKLADILYVDCPWHYRGAVQKGCAQKVYHTMTMKELLALKVPANPERCIMFFWATAPLIPKAMRVIRAWGFEYITCWCWEKLTSRDNIHSGVGYWHRGGFELLFICTKGNRSFQLVKHHGMLGLFRARVAGHSRKPAIARTRIRELFGNEESLTFLELFARPPFDESFHGWSVWGDECPEYPKVHLPLIYAKEEVP